ncbi:MAG TPA: methyltransferase [Acidimicrobiia bacterium]|nr:methyltransferase [Acidimicrobiia bacterium]
MRYGPIPIDAAEEQFLASPFAPLALFDTSLPLVQAGALMAAARHGVFEGLRDGPAKADELAGRLGLDAGTLLLVLRVLAANGYVTVAGAGSFALSDMGRATLLEGSPERQTAWLRLMEAIWGMFAHTGEVLRTGVGIDYHGTLHGADEWNDYQASMLELARRFAPIVAGMVPVKDGATRMLDIGGSHGLYGALIARAHPPLRSEVLDLPEAVAESRGLAAAEGHDDVVSHRAGNALTDDLGAGWDVVLMSNILHHFTPDQIAGLLSRVRAATSPGATVAIWEVVQPPADAPPELMGDAFALFFRLSSTARCYAASEYAAWLTEAGFTDVGIQPFPLGGSLAAITGRTPGA